MEKEKQTQKEELTLEDLQKQIKDVSSQISSLQEENTSLKEQIKQKDLEITKLSLGAVSKSVTKEVKEDEEVSFDFDF